MRPLERIKLILLVAMSLAGPLPAAWGADIQLEITQPKDRAVIRGKKITVSASLHGKLDTLHVVRVQGFGATHNLLADPARATRAQDGTQKVGVYDQYLPHTPGEHTLRIQVFRQGHNDPLIERSISVKVEQPSRSELRKMLELSTRRIINGSCSLIKDRDNFFYSSAEGSTLRSRTPKATKEYFSTRNKAFLLRINAYGDAARIYMEACMTKRAEAAVRFAEEIYKQDSSKVTTSSSLPPFPLVFDTGYSNYPPDHFRVAAELNVRKGKIDQAQRWILDSVAWYEHQRDDNPYLSENSRNRCSTNIAGLYRQLAQLSYLLDQDLARHNAWMKKAELTRKPQSGGGLLGR